MYTFSSKLKTFSLALMLLGALGIGIGFITTPKSIEEVESILKAEEAHHGGGHENAVAHHEAASDSPEASTVHKKEIAVKNDSNTEANTIETAAKVKNQKVDVPDSFVSYDNKDEEGFQKVNNSKRKR
jgi:hypothetical protein